MSKILVIAEHDGARLNPSTSKCVSCAAQVPGAAVDVLVLAEAPEGELERAVGLLVKKTGADEGVRRLERLGAAGRAGGGGDAGVAQRQDHRLSLDRFKAEVSVVRQALLGVAVEVRVRDLGEHALDQPVADGADALHLGGHLRGHDAGRRGHADDAGEVFAA